MKDRVYIIGVGMTPIVKQDGGSFEQHVQHRHFRGHGRCGLELLKAIKDAIGGIWYGNCAQGMLTSQHCIRGQVILRRLGFESMPVVNVENACATASTALNQAIHYVLAGASDLALAVGIEKVMPDLNTSGGPSGDRGRASLHDAFRFLDGERAGQETSSTSKNGGRKNRKSSGFPMRRRMSGKTGVPLWITTP